MDDEQFLVHAQRVIAAWGFQYKSSFVWCKPLVGCGNYWRLAHEFLLLGVRGRLRFVDRGLRSWTLARRTSHSTKPDAIRELVERASPGLGWNCLAGGRARGGQYLATRSKCGCFRGNPMRDAALKWYHVCELCGAEFLSTRSVDECRCGALTSSREQHVPPWVREQEQEKRVRLNRRRRMRRQT